jgi:methionyl aminopeptidase
LYGLVKLLRAQYDIFISMSIVKTKNEIELLRVSGRIAAEILKKVTHSIKPGATTQSLDDFARELIASYSVELAKKDFTHNGGEILTAAFIGEQSGRNGEEYPAVLCASVNDQVVHGLPSDYKIREGDIVSLDFGVCYKGYYSDTAVTVPVGDTSDDARRLIDVTKRSLRQGLKKVRPGNTTGDIGNTIQRWVEQHGFFVVRDLCGHGVGSKLHELPEVPNFGKRHKGEVLQEGMVIAIEPMVNAGSSEIAHDLDPHTFKTKDGSLSAHFEHTVLVTKNGYRILTEI